MNKDKQPNPAVFAVPNTSDNSLSDVTFTTNGFTALKLSATNGECQFFVQTSSSSPL